MTWHDSNSIVSGSSATPINGKPTSAMRAASTHGRIGVAQNKTTKKLAFIQYTKNQGKVNDSSVAASTLGYKIPI